MPPSLVLYLLVETLRNWTEVTEMPRQYFLLWRNAGLRKFLIIIQYKELRASQSIDILWTGVRFVSVLCLSETLTTSPKE